MKQSPQEAKAARIHYHVSWVQMNIFQVQLVLAGT